MIEMAEIIKKSLSEQIYDVLKEEILNHQIGFGKKLTNRELQERFGVSSTPVRDAINRLYQDNLIEEITKVGAKIIDFSLENALEINELIGLLCRDAVILSAKNGDIDEISALLEESIINQERYIDDDEYLYYDYLFHLLFFDHSNNSKLREIYIRYNTLRSILVKCYYSNNTSKAESINQHRNILEHYRAGNIKIAADTMSAHFEHAEIFIKENYDKYFGI